METKKFKRIAIIIAVLAVIAMALSIIIPNSTTNNNQKESGVKKDIVLAYMWGRDYKYAAQDLDLTIESIEAPIPSKFRDLETAFYAEQVKNYDDYRMYAADGSGVESENGTMSIVKFVYYTNIAPDNYVYLYCNNERIAPMPIVDRGLEDHYYELALGFKNSDAKYDVAVTDMVNESNHVYITIQDGQPVIDGALPVPEIENRIENPEEISYGEDTPDEEDITPDEEDVDTPIEAPMWKAIWPKAIGTYYEYMTKNANGNTIMSPESLSEALALYSVVAEKETKNIIDDFISVEGIIKTNEYLAYKSNDSFKTINRLWINETHPFNLDKINLDEGIIYPMDMSEKNATKIKNDWVSEQTDGFITKTPTVFNKNTQLDAMNVVYFKDTWKNGDKTLTDDTVTFNNADGTTTDVKMISESKDHHGLETDTAYGYQMSYNDGFLFTAVVPKEDKTLDDVDLMVFINDEARSTGSDAIFLMPEFEIENEITIKGDNLGLALGGIDKSILSESSEPPVIAQVAKIKVDHTGTEAAAVTEVYMEAMAALEETEPVEIICDRPFYFYIKDNLNHDIAFIGIVDNIK